MQQYMAQEEGSLMNRVERYKVEIKHYGGENMTKPLGVFLQIAGGLLLIGGVAELNVLCMVVGVGLMIVGRKPSLGR